MNHTTRRHHRTLADAFPGERAYAVEIYRRPLLDRIADVTVAVLIGIALACVICTHL